LDTKPLEEQTLVELRKVAEDMGIEKFSRLKKGELLDLILVKQKEAAAKKRNTKAGSGTEKSVKKD
jgi:hypothetical protein